MVRRPDLGYTDEGRSLSDPSTFEAACRPFGTATVLPRVAYRSLPFLYLEDEAIWTRDWVPVGTIHEIPGAGDLLPFTLGYHGVHVQRMDTDHLEARFNLAQHGGCRMVPVQCQQGRRTGCSFTSCGYSRDRGPISTAEGQEDTRSLYQYLGLRPERLHPVQVARSGALISLNVDPDGSSETAVRESDLPLPLKDPAASRVSREWMEFRANWKFAGQALARADQINSMSDRSMVGNRLGVCGRKLTVRWIFPNLILLDARGECCVVVLQHTAIDQTLFRVEILSFDPLDERRIQEWTAEVHAAGLRAERLQSEIPKEPSLDVSGNDRGLPVQEDLAGWWLQKALTSTFASMPRVESDIPIFRNVENYLV